MTMQWRDVYALGIVEVDEQHRQLLSIFSSIEQAITVGGARQDILGRLAGLRDFARVHFQTEERLMVLNEFPGLGEHAVQHREFFRQLNAIENQSLESLARQELLGFLFDWFRDHILVSDRRYAVYLLGQPAIRR